MKDKETLLLICRELRDLYLVDRFRGKKAQRRVVVASDDVKVQEAAETKPWVDEVCFIEQMEYFYAIADDVIEILKAINQWLKSVANEENGAPEELLFWIQHAEGGKTTQRIQDALLLIRSYQRLLEEYHVTLVVLHRRIHHRWEDEILISTARGRGIHVKETRPLLYQIGEKVGVIAVNLVLFGRLRQIYIPARLVYSLHRLMFYRDLYRASADKQNRCLPPDEGMVEIVFQLGSSAYKHVENVVPLMQEFKQRGRYCPIALCWQARGGAKEIRREGLQADELEAWFPLSRWHEVIRRVKQTWKQAKRMKKNLYQSPLIAYRGIPLGHHLWPSVVFFFHGEIIQRIVLKISAENYFKEHHPAAIKLWGDGILDYGAVCRTVIAHQVSDTLTFHYGLGVGVKWPYFEKTSELYLVAGELEKQRLSQDGVPPEQIAVVGQARYDHLTHFSKECNSIDSRRFLNLPIDKEFYLFYAASNIIRGIISSREQFILAEALINFFKNHPNAVLIIKSHPGDNSNIIERLMKQYKAPNIFVVDKKTLPYHCINAADIVVTKLSTVGIEAMLLDTPLISIVLDNENRWQDEYGDVAERFHNTQDLLAFLVLLIQDPEERHRWAWEQQKLRQIFLITRLGKRAQPASKTMANAIEKYLGISREAV